MLDIVIENIMCDHPIKVRESILIGSVAHLLLRHQINGILVVKDNDENKLVGVLTTTDLLRLVNAALCRRTQRLKAIKKVGLMKAGQVASKKVFSLNKHDNIMKAVVLMHRKNIHTIPVYDKGKLVGIIGKHDILNIALI
ncbi:MAG: hypothetical protein A2Z88_00845 [Omnitrophica WOR_2 bacterium GWA2_47_8]|nr:MAG: hypothetical protein A2Z88_00845 [Omnitrophica WOR_2 bacterium GWA2_47_8]